MAKKSRAIVTKKSKSSTKGGVKKQKPDFAKKRKKVGKTLLKPQNETITTFKSRSIIINEQLAEKSSGDDVTNKRYSMEDLLLRFKKNNFRQKLESCKGVKELLEKLTPEAIDDHLGALMTALSPCLLDDDRPLRNMTIRVIALLIERVGKRRLTPHVRILLVHVTCALTSLHEDLQVSGLNCLHMLLRNAPSLLVPHLAPLVVNLLRLLGVKSKDGVTVEKIFTDCIGGKFKIPIKKKTDHEKVKQTKKERETEAAASEQLSSQRSTLLWQLDVLVLLTGILKQSVLQRNKNSALGKSRFGTPWQMLLDSSRPKNASWESQNALNDPVRLQSLVEMVVPLSFRLWGHLQEDSFGSFLSSPAAHCLICISSLLKNLGSMVSVSTGLPASQCSWFVNVVRPVVKDIFAQNFPFNFDHTTSLKQVKNSTYSHPPIISPDDMNIHFSSLCFELQIITLETGKAVTQFVEGLLKGEEGSETEARTFEMENMCQLVVSLVNYFCKVKSGNENVIDRVLEAALECYKGTHPLSKNRSLLLSSMVLQIVDADHLHLVQYNSISLWGYWLLFELSSIPVNIPSLVQTSQQLLLRRAIPPVSKELVDSIEENLKSHLNSNEEEIQNSSQLLNLLKQAIE